MLSDHDFELLIADLLGAELEIIFEAFARGSDCGVDLRHIRHDGLLDVVQCKHITLENMIENGVPQVGEWSRSGIVALAESR